MNSKVSFRSAQPSVHRMGAPLPLPRGVRWFAVLLAATLLAACGGGGDSGGPEAAAGGNPPPSVTTPPAVTPPPSVIAPPETSQPPAVKFTLGGSISGLGSATGLTLLSGIETLPIAAGANSFIFATQLAPNTAYNVTVGTQPSGLSCSVADGSGTLAANVNSVKVSCIQPPVALTTARVSTLAGDGANPIIDGPSASVRFRSPEGVVVDSAGNVYVADTHNHAIRKITPAGIVSTLAGSITAGFADGAGAAARFSLPGGIAVDSSGNVYVADMGNNAIRKISSSGVVTTLMDKVSEPKGVAVDSAGNVYVSSPYSIQKISATGAASTVVSFGGGAMSDVFYDHYLAVDNVGNAYIAESGRVFKVPLSGNLKPLVIGSWRGNDPAVTTLAGAGHSVGFADGDGASALFSYSIRGLAVDNAGNVYVADANAVRKITQAGSVTVTTLAGAGPGISAGFANGVGAAARFSRPVGLAVDRTGNVYVADTGNNLIRKVSPSGNVTTHAGSGYDGDSFSSPRGVDVDSAGNVYVADFGNNMIRKISPSGVASTLAGSWESGHVDGTGTAARFFGPADVAVDSAGNVYVADEINNAIRKITPAGVVITLAGGNAHGFVDGIGTAALFSYPSGVAVDSAGNVYVADKYNHAIRKVSPSGVVTTLAGNGTPDAVNGTGKLASFGYPGKVAVDKAGYVYVADGNGAIRKISPTGVTTTIAPLPSLSFSAKSVAVDGAGNLYVADWHQHVINKILPSGAMATLAGDGTGGFVSGFVDGPGTAARFKHPEAVAVDNAGNVYVADTYNNAIRKIVP